MDDRLKQLASLLIIFCLAGCTGKPNKSTEHVNYGTVVLNDTPTQTNTTVSNYEIALARLQNIPLLDLGTDYKKALKTLKNYPLFLRIFKFFPKILVNSQTIILHFILISVFRILQNKI